MKKNIGFVSLDSCLTEWLLEKLRLSAPDTPAAKELQEGLSELMNGTASSLMVEMGEISPKTFLGDVIHCGALSIDLRLRRVIRDGKEIALTPKEFDILYFLARNRGEVFTKEQIYENVWQESANYTVENTVMVHIRHIREKIEIDAKKPRYVKVVWGIGYKMEKY